MYLTAEKLIKPQHWLSDASMAPGLIRKWHFCQIGLEPREVATFCICNFKASPITTLHETASVEYGVPLTGIVREINQVGV
jgi:hypothetical protein